jgi:hypothetical protein
VQRTSSRLVKSISSNLISAQRQQEQILEDLASVQAYSAASPSAPMAWLSNKGSYGKGGSLSNNKGGYDKAHRPYPSEPQTRNPFSGIANQSEERMGTVQALSHTADMGKFFSNASVQIQVQSQGTGNVIANQTSVQQVTTNNNVKGEAAQELAGALTQVLQRSFEPGINKDQKVQATVSTLAKLAGLKSDRNDTDASLEHQPAFKKLRGEFDHLSKEVASTKHGVQDLKNMLTQVLSGGTGVAPIDPDTAGPPPPGVPAPPPAAVAVAGL